MLVDIFLLAEVDVKDGQQALRGEDLGVVAEGFLVKGVHNNVVGALGTVAAPLQAGFEAADGALEVVE